MKANTLRRWGGSAEDNWKDTGSASGEYLTDCYDHQLSEATPFPCEVIKCRAKMMLLPLSVASFRFRRGSRFTHCTVLSAGACDPRR